MPSQTLYKFLDKADVHYWFDGSIKLSSLSYFRTLEGPEWITDREENCSKFNAQDVHIFHRDWGEGKVLADRLEKTGMFIVPPGTTDARITGLQFMTQQPEVYALCFSEGPFKSARTAMCVNAPDGYRYDACIVLPRPSALIEHIYKEGTIDNQPVRQFFSRYTGSSVKYTKKPTEINRQAPVHYGPFHKPPYFKEQQEFRYVFEPKMTLADRINVRFPPRPDLMKKVF